MSEIQEALELAFDEHEKNTHEPQGTKELPKEEESEREPESGGESGGEPERAVEAGDSAEGTGKAEEKSESKSDTPEPEEPASSEGSDPKEQEQTSLKPPQSWSPQAREKWKDLPREVQEESLKRESEVGKALTESGEARKMVQQFNSMLGQYQGMFASQGVDPISGTNDILQTAAILQGGSPHQKAQTVAGLIQSFGIDLPTLDGLLSGKQQPRSNPEIQHLQQQLKKQEQMFSQLQQNIHSQKTQQIDTEVSAFVNSHEFASDLRMAMADFMDVAQARGVPIDLETAYKRALAERPDLQQLLQNRQRSKNSEQNVQKARDASSSLPQKTAPDPAKKEPVSMREAIERAFEGS